MKVFHKLKYLLLIPIVALIFVALAWSLADLLAYQLSQKERQWIAAGGVNNYRDWQYATNLGRMATILNPYQARYFEMLGRVYFWRFFVDEKPITSFEESQSVVNEGAQYLRDAIEKRPTWPLSWAYLLRLKSVGNQIDSEFVQVWDRAILLGDWEPIVQMNLLEAGLIHWPVLDPSMRERVLKVFVEMTSKAYSTYLAIRTVNRVRLWPLVCAELVDPVVISSAIRTSCRAIDNSSNDNFDNGNDSGLPTIPLIIN